MLSAEVSTYLSVLEELVNQGAVRADHSNKFVYKYYGVVFKFHVYSDVVFIESKTDIYTVRTYLFHQYLKKYGLDHITKTILQKEGVM